MPVIQHKAIILRNTLPAPRANPNKKEKIEYYAELAYPPSAVADIHAMLLETAAGVPLNKLHLPVVKNSAKADKHGTSTTVAGIPGDWLIMRVSTTPEYPPVRADADGVELTNPGDVARVFYAGREVIADVTFKLSAPHQQGQSIWANLWGVIAQAEGQRMAIGNDTRGALARYATPGAASGAAPGANAQSVSQGPAGDPFGGGAAQQGQQSAPQQQAPQQSADPFAQSGAAATSANPFV